MAKKTVYNTVTRIKGSPIYKEILRVRHHTGIPPRNSKCLSPLHRNKKKIGRLVAPVVPLEVAFAFCTVP